MAQSARRSHSVRQALLEGTIVSLLVSAALTAVTIRVDDRRSAHEERRSREDQWRSLLVRDAEFPRAVLAGLDLNGIYAPGISLVAADLTSTDLSNAGLVGARLDGIQANGADLGGAQLDQAVLAGAILTNSRFRGAQLKGADLRGARIDNADFSRAGLFHADLRGLDLRKATFTDTDTRYTCFDASTQWPADRKPENAFCGPDTQPRPLSGAHATIDASLVSELRPRGEAQLYTKALQTREARFALIVEFDNRGIAPLQQVAILTVFPQELDAAVESVTLFNGSSPDGYRYSSDATQNSQVNVVIGDYNAGTNAYVEIQVSSLKASCGKVYEITVYATPLRLGSIADKATVERVC